MSKDMMVQCKLSKGNRVDIGWIEERGAKVGAIVERKYGEGERDPDWKVEEVYGSLPADQVQENAKAYKHHRSRTDI